MTLNNNRQTAKSMKNLIMKNAPDIARIEQRMYVLKVVQSALEAGITKGSYQKIIMDLYPDYYKDDAAKDRLIRVWNGRQIDFEIIDHIKAATEYIKQS